MDDENTPVADVVVSYPSTSQITFSSKPVIVDQQNRAYVPKVSVINAGQYVDFPNSDNIRHHVFSFSRSNPFEIKLYKNRPSAPIHFPNPGLVTLGCNIHDQMVGYIYVVRPGNKAGKTASDGKFSIPEGVLQIRVWHPRLSLTQADYQDIALDPNALNEVLILDLLPPLEQTSGPAFGDDTFEDE